MGPVGLSPMAWGLWALLFAVPIGVLLALGIAGVGGISLESAMRRASLVGQLRFALAVRGLRTVVVLSRLLAAERPRPFPPVPPLPGHGGRLAVWKAGWSGVLAVPRS